MSVTRVSSGPQLQSKVTAGYGMCADEWLKGTE